LLIALMRTFPFASIVAIRRSSKLIQKRTSHQIDVRG
jgi:hypothetical protein